MHPSSSRPGHRSSYSKSGPKPGTASSCLSAKTAQCLIALPLVLALFALSLQVGYTTVSPRESVPNMALGPHSACMKHANFQIWYAVDDQGHNRPEAASHNARGLCKQVLQVTQPCTGSVWTLIEVQAVCCSDRLSYAQLPGSMRKELREVSDGNSGSKPQQSAGQQSGVEWRPAGTDLKGQKVIAQNLCKQNMAMQLAASCCPAFAQA